MKTIEQLIRECDNLASRYYRLDSGSRERAARDWLEQVRKTAKMINNRFKKPIMNEKEGKFSQSF
jgi:hypothetical protein